MVFVFLAGILLCRLTQLQGRDHQQWLQLAATQRDANVKIQGVRGTIRDLQGRTLAVSVPAFSLGAHPRKIEKKRQY